MRYNSFDEVLNYCERSANPVGRIILEFFDIRDDESMQYSDAICTALQLTNFYQDVSLDINKNRIYISIDEIERFGVKLNQFELRQNNTNFEQLLKYQVDRTKNYFSKGKNLFPRLPGRLQKQIKATVLGGEKILDKIERINYNVLNHRPKLSKIDYINILLKALVK
jgi:phytoene/squalene synthetase